MTPPNRMDYTTGLLEWARYKTDMLAWKACMECARCDECIEFEYAYARDPHGWRQYVLRQE